MIVPIFLLFFLGLNILVLLCFWALELAWKKWTPEDYFPLHKVVWRFIWLIPMLVSRLLFVLIVFIRNGWREGKQVWEVTG